MARQLLAAAAAAALLAGCSSMGADGTATTAAGAPADMTPSTRDAYVQMAAASDLFEIQSSQLALTRAKNPAVRDFARMLVEHHTNTSNQLMSAAQASGMGTVTPQLMPMQQQMMTRLQAASEAQFDRVYMRQQVPAHEMALALHSNYAQNGDTPALKVVAAGAVPIVTQHLTQARTLD